MIKQTDTYDIDPLDIELKEHLAHYSHVEAKPDGFPGHFYIKKYLETRINIKNGTSNHTKLIHCMSLKIILSGYILYRSTPDLDHFRCTDAAESTKFTNTC